MTLVHICNDPFIPAPEVYIQRMRLSDGSTDYFVTVKVQDRITTPHMFKDRYKAEYVCAYWRHIFFNEPLPDLLAYNEESHPND